MKFTSLFEKILKYIVLFVVVYLVVNYITSILYSAPIYVWWNQNNGSNYKGVFDITSLALYNNSKILFDFRNFITVGSKNLDSTSLLFLNNVLLNKIYEVDPKTGNIIPGRFLKPLHLCESIIWGDDDEYTWYFSGIRDFYKDNFWWEHNKFNQKLPLPSDNIWTSASWCDGISPIKGVTPQKYTGESGGFWPNQNGCIGFFDVPPGDNTSPDDGKRFDLISNFPIPGKARYIPGYPGGLGSWAQLFADWGIVYTLRNKSGLSSIPVVSDGLACANLQPCDDYCVKQSKLDKMPDFCPDVNPKIYYPESNTDLWFKTGINSDGGPGINFISAYKIPPDSFLITSWIGGYYNDSSVKKMIFDAQAFPNLLGIGGFGKIKGGWIKFLKGTNTSKNSFDSLINFLFRDYATSVSNNLISYGKVCGVAHNAAVALSMISYGGFGAMFGPLGIIIGASYGANSSKDAYCN